MRFSVLGVGAVGSLVAHHLRRTRPPDDSVRLLFRRARNARLAAHGAEIRVERDGVASTATGFVSAVYDPAARVPLEPPAGAPPHSTASPAIDVLIVATKAYAVVPPIKDLLPQLSSHSTVVLCQNGMGIYEDVIHYVFRNPDQRPNFVVASNTHGAWIKGPSHVVHAGLGRIQFAVIPDGRHNTEASFHNPGVPEYDRKLTLADVPTSGPTLKYRTLHHAISALQGLTGLNTSWVPYFEMQNIQRRKLVANSVINPLTSLMGCQNGKIFEVDAARRILRRICHEAETVFLAEYNAAHGVGQGAAITRPELRGLSPMLRADALEQECLRVAQVTSQNLSSMLLDVRRGKKTEIAHMNGFLLKLGRTYNVSMPCTAMLSDLIQMRSSISLPTNL